MQRRNSRRVSGGAAIAAAITLTACGGGPDSMPADAIEAWQGPNAALRNQDVRRWILSFAILAPHAHNMQSWIVDLTKPDEIVLRCDLNRLLPETDPFSRQIVMSHGTFLELLDMAAKECGLRADIALFPKGPFSPNALDERPVAHIKLVADSSVAKDPLFKQVLLRHTNRKLYDLARPPQAVAMDDIQAAAKSTALNSATAVHTGSSTMDTLSEHRRIAKAAWAIEMTTSRTIMESYKVLRVGADEISQHRDGLSLNSSFVATMKRFGLFDPTQVPKPGDSNIARQISDFNKNIDSTPAFFWISTPANDRVTQVQAGRAWVRSQLAATSHGLAMQPISQALQEYPEQKDLYGAVHQLTGAAATGSTLQMWARVGYAPAVPASPRRRLSDIVVM
jgi:hypothetical protein